MAGRGPAPKDSSERRRRNKPAAGEWKPAPGVGWQHGAVPKPPARLSPAARAAWARWFKAWYAAHWTPDVIAGLVVVIRLYDEVVTEGNFVRAGELRLQMDAYGLTPKGQQMLRWKPPTADENAKPARDRSRSRYGHLRAV